MSEAPLSSPTALLVFPESWLASREHEWDPLSAAAAGAGFQAVVAHWNALALLADGAVSARECFLRRPGDNPIRSETNVIFTPAVVLTTWGVDREHRELFREITAASRSYSSEFPLLAHLDGKRELELCLRNYENQTGRLVSRPPTRISEEISASDAEPGDELVIVKPSQGGQCQGIEIVPRRTLPLLAQEVAAQVHSPFVAQELIENVFLYEGRRWDIRVHAMATSLSPLRYRLYREGVAKTAAAEATPGSGRLEEWLNADSYLKDKQPPENLSVTDMLRYVAREYMPLPDFWTRVDELVRDVFASIALRAEEEQAALDRFFLFPGFDLIVERRGARDYDVRLLELNSHPGLGWEPHIRSALAPQFHVWFADLLALAKTP
jgi:hypothetical protein